MSEITSSVAPRTGSILTQRNYSNTPFSTQYQSNSLVSDSPHSYPELAIQSWIAKSQMEFADTGAAFGASSAQATGTQSNYRPLMAQERVLGMQKWAGSILAIEEDILTVELFPLDHDGPSLVADFDIRLLSPDQSLAKQGSVVYLTTRLIEDEWGKTQPQPNCGYVALGIGPRKIWPAS
jgi:hypothetical protein